MFKLLSLEILIKEFTLFHTANNTFIDFFYSSKCCLYNHLHYLNLELKSITMASSGFPGIVEIKGHNQNNGDKFTPSYFYYE